MAITIDDLYKLVECINADEPDRNKHFLLMTAEEFEDYYYIGS